MSVSSGILRYLSKILWIYKRVKVQLKRNILFTKIKRDVNIVYLVVSSVTNPSFVREGRADSKKRNISVETFRL